MFFDRASKALPISSCVSIGIITLVFGILVDPCYSHITFLCNPEAILSAAIDSNLALLNASVLEAKLNLLGMTCFWNNRQYILYS